MRLILALALLQDPDGFSKKFEAARPTDAELAIYRLNWVAKFEDAKARAAREKRPLLLIYVTNITAGENFYAGHT